MSEQIKKHWYGRWKQFRTKPPRTSTGIVTKQWYAMENVVTSSWILDKILGRAPTYKYFIFEYISGTTTDNGDYTSRISYWCYDQIAARNDMFNLLESKA